MIIKILLFILGALLLALLLLVLWFIVSPMPVVLMMRRGKGAPPAFPEGYGEKLEQTEIMKNLPYPSSCGKNRYDLYYPKNPGRPLPLILWVHGGAFVAGEKDGVENWAVCLACEGYAVAAMDYEWAPEAHWPAQLIQAGECLKAISSQTHGSIEIDMGRVILAGDSAGAHMAAQLALQHTSRKFSAETGLSPVLRPGSVKAVLLYCGPYDIRQMASPRDRRLRLFMSRVGWSYLGKKKWQDSPQAEKTIIANYIEKAFPPCFITDGNSYSFDSQGRALAAALKEIGVTVRTLFFDKEKKTVLHEYQFALDQPDALQCYNATVEFLKELHLYDS